jgi:ectoine hydroxylase-related dioxygenase (phytanoyl-CoA dioxygenase family)
MGDYKTEWDKEGYLAIDHLLSAQDLIKLRHRFDELAIQGEHLSESTDRFKMTGFESIPDPSAIQGNAIQMVAEPHELCSEVMDLARDSRILDIVETALGPNIQLYYSQIFMKPSTMGDKTPWHQDFAFYAHTRADLLNVHIYIDDSTVENGCLRVVPRSQHLGILNHFKDGVFTGEVQGDTSQYDEQEVALPMKAGGMVMWHTMTLHRSYPNKSTKQRRALVLAYKNPEARLMGGAWNTLAEVRSVGLMVRGRDPTRQLLATY